MLELRFYENCKPRYMTERSAACDLVARESSVLKPGQIIRVPTGVWIANVDWAIIAPDLIPELQIRARSGLAMRYGICLANCVGTVDADYRDEIGVLLINLGKEEFLVNQGDRIAQMTLCFVTRLKQLSTGGVREGGFGSTHV